MKKLLVVLGIAVSSFTYAAETVNQKVLASFKADFANVSNVKWTLLEENGLYQANFLFNGEELNAFYNEEGEMVGTSRYIRKAQLPILIQKEISSRFPEHAITTVIERTLNGNVTYFVTADSLKNALVLQSSSSGDVTVYKKIKKASLSKN